MGRRRIKGKSAGSGNAGRSRRRASRVPAVGISSGSVAPPASRSAGPTPSSVGPSPLDSVGPGPAARAPAASAPAQAPSVAPIRSIGVSVPPSDSDAPPDRASRQSLPTADVAPQQSAAAPEPARATDPGRPSAVVSAAPRAQRASEPPSRPVSEPPPGEPAQPASDAAPRSVGRRTDPEMVALSADFFEKPRSKPPEAWVDDYVVPTLARSSKRAMQATVGLIAVGLVGLSGFLVYNKVIMPTPVELGAGGAYAMPVPIIDSRAETVMVPAPEEAPQLRVHEPTAMAVLPTNTDPVGSEQAPPAFASDAPSALVETDPPVTTDTVNAAPPAESSAADDGYEQLLAEGTKLARKGRSKDALRVLEQARALRPSGGGVLAELAFLHLNRGNNAEAGELAGRAVAVDPTISMAWIVLGAARDAARDRSGAKAAYAQCAALPIDEYVRECRRLAR